MSHSARKDWRQVSEAAAREYDPKKLMELVEELNRLLEERENQLRKASAMPQTRSVARLRPRAAILF